VYNHFNTPKIVDTPKKFSDSDFTFARISVIIIGILLNTSMSNHGYPFSFWISIDQGWANPRSRNNFLQTNLSSILGVLFHSFLSTIYVVGSDHRVRSQINKNPNDKSKAVKTSNVIFWILNKF
jgi:hypothetical protein